MGSGFRGFLDSNGMTPGHLAWWGYWIYALAVLFLIGGVVGWTIELFFRRFVSQHKWVNPGFLQGPFLPLYGFGNAILFLMSVSEPTMIPLAWANHLLWVIIEGAAMTLVEFIAGLIFIKGLKVKLWDYSSQPGNIMGLICPLFSAFWVIIAALYLFFLRGPFDKMVMSSISFIYPWLVGLGLGFGILFADCVYSFQIVNKVQRVMKTLSEKTKPLAVNWDLLKFSLAERRKKNAQRLHLIFPFRGNDQDFAMAIADQGDEKNGFLAIYHRKRAERKAKRQLEKSRREGEKPQASSSEKKED